MNTDTASVTIESNAETVFKFMSDPNKMDLWSFGTWRVSVDGDGLVSMAVPSLTDLPFLSALSLMRRIS